MKYLVQKITSLEDSFHTAQRVGYVESKQDSAVVNANYAKSTGIYVGQIFSLQEVSDEDIKTFKLSLFKIDAE